MIREEALRKTYQSVAHRVSYDEEVFVNALKDWDVAPVYDGQEVIGSILSKSNEVHIGVYRRPKASIWRFIRESLQGIIDKYGFAITTVPPQNSVGLRFCERLGFVKIGERGGYFVLRCDRSNYQ